MSDQANTASFLDELILGEPISNHHGVRCCPAIRENSDEKYIVKIVSLPANPSHLDALLLTGACADEKQALNYYQELAQEISNEAQLLQKLSNLEGFDGYICFEIREMARSIGYQVFLLSKYRPSLSKLMQDKPLTHLAAVNLGLDLCEALTACRRMGYLYVDLRPDNVFFSENQGYRIGDLGFISMASLPYASLPERYRSTYTAPEVTDALSSLSETMDIYALGLTLYQVFNNGQLPFENTAPATALPAPLYADYEMAAIILKACAPDPKYRWADPAEMRQALVDYMQRNSVNATPIIPAPIIMDLPAEDENVFLSEEENDAQLAELLAQLPEELPPEQLAMDGSSHDLTGSEPPKKTEAEGTQAEIPDDDQLSFLDHLTNDETAPSDDDIANEEVSEELADFFAQIDHLVAHELPQPVVAPGPIDVPVPPPAIEEPDTQELSDMPAVVTDEPEAALAEEEETANLHYDTEDEYLYDLPPKRKPRRWIAAIIAAALLIGALAGGYFWYTKCFIQRIDALTVQGSGDDLKVTVVSKIDEKLLTVVLTDTYGNTMRSPVLGGAADFSDLNPATQYRIRVEISGLHKLTGNTTGLYTTEEQTEILNFTAVCGPEDGSVILNFSVNGPDNEQWSVIVSSDDSSARTQKFSGHNVTITDLTPGKRYTFRLEAESPLPLAGQTELNYTAQKILYAQDLQVTACAGGSLTVQWSQPDAPAGQLWLLRCYNDAGYDQTVSTTDLNYTFHNLDHATGYTVLVTADGMTQSVSASVTANPVTITGYTAQSIAAYALQIDWAFSGATPENGWILRYRVNGGEEMLLPCSGNSATLARTMDGIYEFTAVPADDITCFTQSYQYTDPSFMPFEGFGITAHDLSAALILKPEDPQWSYADLTEEDHRTAFTPEEQAVLVLLVGTDLLASEEAVNVTFAVRNSMAQLDSAEQMQLSWNAMWDGECCPLAIPTMPQLSGTYTMDLFFNDQWVTTVQFSII